MLPAAVSVLDPRTAPTAGRCPLRGVLRQPELTSSGLSGAHQVLVLFEIAFAVLAIAAASLSLRNRPAAMLLRAALPTLQVRQC